MEDIASEGWILWKSKYLQKNVYRSHLGFMCMNMGIYEKGGGWVFTKQMGNKSGSVQTAAATSGQNPHQNSYLSDDTGDQSILIFSFSTRSSITQQN